MIRTNLEGANLTGCQVYGISAWNVNLVGAQQSDLVITAEGEPVITVDNLEVPPNLRHLYAHLLENHYIEGIRSYNPDYLATYSTDILKKIKARDASWEKLVPPPIVEVIKSKKLFGYS